MRWGGGAPDTAAEDEERANAMRAARNAAARKIEAAGRGKIARLRVEAAKSDPEVAARAAAAKSSDAYSGGSKSPQTRRPHLVAAEAR